MTKVIIEAKHNRTPEYHFLDTIIKRFFQDREVRFIFMDGIGNLFKEAIVNQIKLAQEDGEQVLVLVDADTVATGHGYAVRRRDIETGMSGNSLSLPYFIYPDNQHDGSIEDLMAAAARRDLHPAFFDCFEDYERCVSGVKDESGESRYRTPNLKGKLHTYITAQKLPSRLSRRLGSGEWLFDNIDYWRLDVEALRPLKDFLDSNLK